MTPYAHEVLDAVARVPKGRVATYGDIAVLVGRGGPRQVGQTLARHGAEVPWHRVLRADGRPAEHLRARQVELLAAEGVRLVGGRVDLSRHRWT